MTRMALVMVAAFALHIFTPATASALESLLDDQAPNTLSECEQQDG